MVLYHNALCSLYTLSMLPSAGLSEEERKRREEEQAELERMRERMKQNEEIMKRMNMTW